MRTLTGLVLGTVLAIGLGCVKSDWIDRTLVTENVTGVWEGSMITSSGAPMVRDEVRFELEQKGPAVTGLFRGKLYGVAPSGTVLLEGSIAGDVFKFRDTRGTLSGELTVGGDEMTGQGVSGHNRPVTLRLRRVDSVAPPR